MLAALLPSRLTSHFSRNSVSGTQRPKYANMLPRQAAPHSDACICSRIGVVILCFKESGAVLSPAPSEAPGGIYDRPVRNSVTGACLPISMTTRHSLLAREAK